MAIKRFDDIAYEPVNYLYGEPKRIVPLVQVATDDMGEVVVPLTGSFTIRDSQWALVDVVASSLLAEGKVRGAYPPPTPDLVEGDYHVRCEYTYDSVDGNGNPVSFTGQRDSVLWIAPRGSQWVEKCRGYIGGQYRLISDSDLIGLIRETIASGETSLFRLRVELAFLEYLLSDYGKVVSRQAAQGSKSDPFDSIEKRMTLLRKSIAENGATSPATGYGFTL